ncbi:MAG: hypothetical protein H6621_03370 [Halobacteriovoraceae bacterium]|nr:hypothetical protein [Halobacteriovoraceae bacterium]MCB9094087.1 hypothetical protein [Halobacteriovoraceae bacterium]
MKKILFLLTLFLVVTSCTLAPIYTPKNARSLPPGNFEVDIGVYPVISGNASYGVTADFDLGVTFEQQLAPVAALWGKYSFLNNPAGFALAAYGGYFKSGGAIKASGYMLGPIASFRTQWFEAYMAIRYNTVNYTVSEISQSDSDEFIFDLNLAQSSMTYWQLDLGFNFWVTETFAVNIGGVYFNYIDGVSNSTDFTPTAAVLFKF